MRWSVGVTTVPQRRCDLLPQTLHSLKLGGFNGAYSPRLFVDGSKDPQGWMAEFGLEVTSRWSAVRTAGNWVLSLVEMYFRNPEAEVYAVFQDDLVCVRNLREYVERSIGKRLTANDGNIYLNLYTAFKTNEELQAEFASRGGRGWLRSNQKGKGGLGLVFSKRATMALLSARAPNGQGGFLDWSHLVARTQNPHRGWRCIDGGVVEAMTHAGYTEMIHSPSLVQHTGDHSSMGNDGKSAPASSFPGEEIDALSFLSQS